MVTVPLESEYNAGQYEQVVADAPAELAGPGASRSDSIRTYELDAFSLIALGRNDEASGVFRRLLIVDPNVKLDPESTSPKIQAVFDQVREAQSSAVSRQPPAVGRQPLAALVPGLGQIRNHQPAKGYALLGVFAVSLAGVGLSQADFDHAHQAYLQATTPTAIEARYQTANGWYRARTVCIGAAAVVWLASLVDALSQR
jgi:hypothetical protein